MYAAPCFVRRLAYDARERIGSLTGGGAMRAAIYTRVSTVEQAQSGAGLAAQEDAARALAGRMGAEVAGVFADEGVSGSVGLEKRPALLEAIAALRKGDVLLVAKRDRIGRLDPMAMAMIQRAVERKGARIVSAAGEGTSSDDPSEVLMRRMIDAFSEYERLVIGARTSAAMQPPSCRSGSSGDCRSEWNVHRRPRSSPGCCR